MNCDKCKGRLNYKLHSLGGGVWVCENCYLKPKKVMKNGSIISVVYIDKKNGEKPIKTSLSEINHIRGWKPNDHNGTLGY